MAARSTSEAGSRLPDHFEEDPLIPKRIFVGNLSFDTTPDRLRDALEPAGEVVDLRIVTDRETGRSRGFAFVEFSSDEQAEQAIQLLNDQEVDGREAAR